MDVTRELILKTLINLQLPDGGNLVSRDLIRALTVEAGSVKFVIEAASPDQARALEPLCRSAEEMLRALPGVTAVSVVLTAHSPSTQSAPKPPSLTIGRHPTPPAGPARVPGVDRILAIASGKGGVG